MKKSRWSRRDFGPAWVKDHLGNISTLEMKEIQWAAWSPGYPGTKATQVHLLFSIQGIDSARFSVRFKSPEALDQFLAIAKEYRSAVWPEDGDGSEDVTKRS